jgi:DNA recombination protein RmuC
MKFIFTLFFTLSFLSVFAQENPAGKEINEAIKEMDAGNFSQSRVILEGVLQKDATNYDAWYEYAYSYYMQKDYAKAVGSAVDFVVLFVPGENFLGAALEHDRSLMNDFFKRHVVLAGPVNLVAVARTVGALRDQARLAKDAADIAKLGRELYDSIRLMGNNFAAVQKSLEATVGNWNRLVSQAEARVVTRARKLKDMGAATGLDDLPELAPVAQVPMLPSASELAVVVLPAPDAA